MKHLWIVLACLLLVACAGDDVTRVLESYDKGFSEGFMAADLAINYKATLEDAKRIWYHPPVGDKKIKVPDIITKEKKEAFVEFYRKNLRKDDTVFTMMFRHWEDFKAIMEGEK